MKKKINVLSLLLSLLFISFSSVTYAEEFIPASKLFSIDIPEGWTTRDNKNTEFSMIYIVNPEGTNGMKIMTGPSVVREDETIENYLERRILYMAQKVKSRDQGKLLDVSDIEIDGVAAKHMGFEMMTKSGMQHGSQTILIHNGYQYMRTYGSSDKEEKKEMDKIASTFRFYEKSSEHSN